MTTNRIDEILQEVRLEIEKKRSLGKFGVGYEAGIEDPHNLELGKLAPEIDGQIEPLRESIQCLHEQIASLSRIERDTAKFAPWRFLRELAMSRHQLIRLNRELRSITETIETIASTIVETAVTRTQANERAAQDLLDLVFERTLVMDKLLVMCRELEIRVETLEKS